MTKNKLKEQFLKVYSADESILDFITDAGFRKAISCYYKEKISLERIAKKTGITKQGVHSTCQKC